MIDSNLWIPFCGHLEPFFCLVRLVYTQTTILAYKCACDCFPEQYQDATEIRCCHLIIIENSVVYHIETPFSQHHDIRPLDQPRQENFCAYVDRMSTIASLFNLVAEHPFSTVEVTLAANVWAKLDVLLQSTFWFVRWGG